MPFYKELGNQGIKAEDIPVIAFSVGEEELAGLDTAGTDWLIELLKELRSRHSTICVASPRVAFLQGVADRIVGLRSGRLQDLSDTTQSVVDRPDRQRSAA